MIAIAAVIAPTQIAPGQAPPAGGGTPQDIAIDAVRTRSEIPENDPSIDGWITYRLEKLRAEVGIPPQGSEPTPSEQFVNAFRTESAHAQNSNSFKQRLAEQTARRFASELQSNAELDPRVAEAFARALLAMENVAAMNGLVAGLRAKSYPAVRYLSAKALAALIPAIQADQGLTASTLQVLKSAGAEETSPAVLQQIYEAMYYRERLNVAVPAILDLMEAQLKLRANAPAGSAAEEPVIAFLKREIAGIQDRNRLVGILAAHLRLDVERYLSPNVSPAEKDDLERIIDAVEGLLAQIVSPTSPAPNVRDAMKKPENQNAAMPVELAKWIGSEQSRGVLNDPPWNVPVGAPVVG